MNSRAATLAPLLLCAVALPARAEEPYHPYFEAPQVRTVDLGTHVRPAAAEVRTFSRLAEYQARDVARREAGRLPDGLVQQGNVVVPQAVADGSLVVDHQPLHAVEDIPGNKYPRKHTVFLNFLGADLNPGPDNSAEDYSTLARMGPYPAFAGSNAVALAAVQAFENDVAAYGIRTRYESRPNKTVPYTMVMIGGTWMDTNLEDPAGGVAPGTDCGALGQRHVVYTFAGGGWGGTAIANVSSQEAGHAWGLDHSFNCNSVMAYCGGGDKFFSTACDGVCEEQCQGAAGCLSTHEMFCDEGDQNEGAELNWIFGGNEPDMTPPTAEIVEPADGTVIEEGESVQLRAIVDDDYGGFGWKFTIAVDGEVMYDEVDYDRDVDPMYRAALNLVNLDPGEYTLTIEVEDQYEHVTTDTVTLVVEPAADSGEPDPSESDGESSGGEPSSGTGSGDPDTMDPAEDDDASDGDDDDDDNDDGDADTDVGTSADDGEAGCACRASGAGSGAWMLLGLALLGLRRRAR